MCCFNNKFDSTPCSNNNNTSEYIIFLNVHKAIYCNFKITSDMSLETLAEHVYDNVRCTIKGRLIQKPLFATCTKFIASDNNNSISLELHASAKIIVARTIKPDERYHQRVTGYIDFENRHDPDYCIQIDEKERARKDREYEIRLLGSLT